MLKNFTKYLIVTGLIALSLFVIFVTNTLAYSGGTNLLSIIGLSTPTLTPQPVGTIKYISYFEDGFFCINHGQRFMQKDYRVYESGYLSDLYSADPLLLPFLAGESKGIHGTPGTEADVQFGRQNQPWAHKIWSLGLGQNSQTPDPSLYAEMDKRYAAYKEIYAKKDGPIDIQAINPDGAVATEVLLADANGYAKIQLDYPWAENINLIYWEGVEELLNIKISVTNNSGTKVLYDETTNLLKNSTGGEFKIGDTEAYIPVSELTYGEYHDFEIEWNFKYYDKGVYDKWTPVRQIRYAFDTTTECSDEIYVEYTKVFARYGTYNLPAGWVLHRDNEIIWHINNNEFSASEAAGEGYRMGRLSTTGEDVIQHIVDGEAHLHYLDEMQKLNRYGNWVRIDDASANWQDVMRIATSTLTATLKDNVRILFGQPNIKINLDKVDALIKSQLSGVQFEVTVENGAVVNGDTTVNPYTFTTNGTTQTIEIKPDNSNGIVNQIIVRLKEVSTVEGYLQYLSEIVITFTWNMQSSQWELTDLQVPDFENATQTLGTEKNEWTINAENRPKIELSGVVWIDEPTGEKKIDPPNGYFDGGESAKSGVEVYLYKSDGTWVREDGYGNTYGTDGYLVTDSSGAYKFENIPKLPSGQGYYILFRYDGINYIRTVDGQSKATEKDRAAFNARFKTISAGQSNDGTPLSYNYDGSSISTLITEDGSGKVLDEFAISADTLGTTYNETTTDIDLGLREKVVDLSLMTDLYKATATINEVPVEYTYNDIFDATGTINGIINASQDITSGTKNYTMDLYRSDYNYRIGDYLGGSPSLSHQPSLDTEEQTALQDSREELQVYLYYVVLLNNQSVTEAQVEEFVYYYDSNLTPVSIDGGQAINSGGTLIITPDTTNLGYGEQTRITIQFSYNVASTESQPTIRNYGEITRYSTTEGGYVDCDSAPGNAFEGGTFKYEDDADAANGLKINIASSEREISGYVYEDNKLSASDNSSYITGNGQYDSGETRIDDVIVQLVEVKNLVIGGTTHRLEYIWQETTTGSNVVRAISADGTSIGTYTVPAETGKYTFRGFIPGDYIVRFIYGDGTYYDSAINANNILKYNGQDYKSTVDKLYTSSWLTIGDGGYSEHDSMARDIEPRRLTVMKYALETDPSNLQIDSKEKLEDTWMVADTSKIGVPDSMLAQTSTSFIRQGVDFGLVQRPQTTLKLVKHITSLRLNGTNFDIGASVNIAAYSDDTTEIMSQIIKSAENGGSLTAQATTRGNRGYWQVESNNIEGTNLTLEYTYRVTNIGEPEYLHSTLVNKFSEAEGLTTYLDAIQERINETNSAIKSNSYRIADSYLGTAYYSGTKGGQDTEIGTYVKLEDYLSNELTFNGTASSDFEKVSDSETKKIVNMTNNEAEENVKVVQTRYGKLITSGQGADFTLKLTKTLSAAGTSEFPSYIAQIISPAVNLAGSRITGTTPNNAKYVQAYADMATLDNLGMEADEYWGETFRVIPTTGEDKQSSYALTIAITSGLAVMVVGIVLIRKFIIK